MRIESAEIPGRGRVDVRLAGGQVAEIGPHLAPRTGEPTFDAAGGALLPGLHDHHLHLLATAAALASIRCGPPEVGDEAALRSALGRARAGPDGWVRGVGYHESVAGPLDRDRLDRWQLDFPVRIQHRTGALWVLCSKGLAELGVGERPESEPEGLERDADGRATGRLFRGDAWLRERIGSDPPPLGGVGRVLARRGVTGVTDATPTNGPRELDHVERASAAGQLPQTVHWMGGPLLPTPRGGLAPPWKIVLDERTLPLPEELAARVARAHTSGRPVAIHCVTRAELVVACAAIEAAGPLARDRVEHASVAPPDTVEWLSRLGVTVVTQPGFVFERGDRYRVDVDPGDQAWLYRCAGLDEAGVALGAGTDAPYGEPDPWRAMQAAVERRTAAGARLCEKEALTPERALALFTTEPTSPGGAPRRIEPGRRADLCLLREPWERARERLSADGVRATFCAGRLVWDSDAS